MSPLQLSIQGIAMSVAVGKIKLLVSLQSVLSMKQIRVLYSGKSQSSMVP